MNLLDSAHVFFRDLLGFEAALGLATPVTG
jgi:hypothetical protein